MSYKFSTWTFGTTITCPVRGIPPFRADQSGRFLETPRPPTSCAPSRAPPQPRRTGRRSPEVRDQTHAEITRGGAAAQLVEADASAVPLEDASFDAAFSTFTHTGSYVHLPLGMFLNSFVGLTLAHAEEADEGREYPTMIALAFDRP